MEEMETRIKEFMTKHNFVISVWDSTELIFWNSDMLYGLNSREFKTSKMKKEWVAIQDDLEMQETQDFVLYLEDKYYLSYLERKELGYI